jgi:hypothetical protein
MCELTFTRLPLPVSQFLCLPLTGFPTQPSLYTTVPGKEVAMKFKTVGPELPATDASNRSLCCTNNVRLQTQLPEAVGIYHILGTCFKIPSRYNSDPCIGQISRTAIYISSFFRDITRRNKFIKVLGDCVDKQVCFGGINDPHDAL